MIPGASGIAEIDFIRRLQAFTRRDCVARVTERDTPVRAETAKRFEYV